MGSNPTNACGAKELDCHVGYQEVAGAAPGRRTMNHASKGSTLTLNPGQASLEVQIRGISGPIQNFV